MINLSSYCGLVDAKIRASDKDLPVQEIIEKNGENVADIVTLIPRMDYYDITYSLPVQIIRFIFESCYKFNI